MDNIIPTHGYSMLPMVGLGGSAGGIPALRNFFSSMPPDNGLVFLVVFHPSPPNPLPEILTRCTSMRVESDRDGVQVEPNCIYVTPPGKHLTAADGQLQLSNLEHKRGSRVEVDFFSDRSPIVMDRMPPPSFCPEPMAMEPSASNGLRSAGG
jgi:two-component system, chemotaxis family, CheB/CheR fusion protein